ncbi:hypothetical protein BDP81DRAFT_398439 [Colletotrichum phormii]|uniref:Uncharacterized protein n=1 Tax=Colletotrichum phormii TaxID=359342 RepID=A0AAI9ZH28_9PEZI|nr:uncharacterized protein BDP81DRAFT_398439 [Colletotrichum phormii]KAK1624341.1 hypothetical protein BDP81DRAFT_398439 [Colletotrichum phormii]
MRSSVAWSLAVLPLAIVAYFTDLPAAFNDTPARWAYVSYGDPSVAVLPGSFNRSAMDALYKGHATDPELEKRNAFLNTTNFIAYDERFMDILGPKATITQAGDGVDVIDPVSGLALGTVRVGGGSNLAVNMAFGENELWIVGRGGVWHVTGVAERLD